MDTEGPERPPRQPGAMIHLSESEVDPEEPEFVQTRTGTVHVIDYDRRAKPLFGDTITMAEALIRLIIGVSYCGLVMEGRKGHSQVTAFDDDLLCQRCWEGWPFEKRLLFEHSYSEQDGVDTLRNLR